MFARPQPREAEGLGYLAMTDDLVPDATDDERAEAAQRYLRDHMPINPIFSFGAFRSR